MNFGHIIGHHTYESQFAGIIHELTSWAPVILALAAGLAVSLVYRSRILQFVTERIRKQQ